MTPFPMPNDRLGDRVVVASVEYRDEPTMIALVLLLASEAPFFEVAHVFMEDCPSESHGLLGNTPERREGEVMVLGRHENIVYAVHEYEDAGGEV